VDLTEFGTKVEQAVQEIETVIVGKQETVRLVLVALLCNGHVLIEDIPGVGKTMLARAVAKVLGCSFKRLQFTPDLLPADITGTAVYNQKTGEFEFRPGPVFANIALADEINRATPKTQSALLECMEESQVTSDGVTYQLPRPFFVVATENNIELHGTYPLPEAQLDRFWLKLSMGYPSREDEMAILTRQADHHPVETVRAVLEVRQILDMQERVKHIHLDPKIGAYIVDLVGATRAHPKASLGASPRGSLCLMHSCRALAAMSGREYVLPDDVKELAKPVLAHRVLLRPEARARDYTSAQLVQEAMDSVPVPVLE
jgi:MoxR-like ATPase